MTVNANTQIYDSAVDRAAMVRLYERRVNGKIDVVLDGHAKKVDGLLSSSELTREGRDRLKKQLDEQILATYKETFSLSKRSLLDLAEDQISYAYQGVEKAVGKIWQTERPSKRVAEEFVLKKPLHQDVTLEAGWSNIAKGERQRIEAIIRKGIAEGRSVNEIALDVRKGNVHTISRNQSRGLVVTAITSVQSQADHAVYAANEKAITGWQYIAVLDARTTPVCARRDGVIYPVSDTVHLPPSHFHCRSTTSPVFKSWAQMGEMSGVARVRKENLAKLSKSQVAFYDGQTPLRETYSDWLKRQPKDVQYRHLGDYKKVELFQSGQLELDQFTNPEGNSIGIKELRKLTDSGYSLSGDTYKFAAAKRRLDAMQIWARSPEDFLADPALQKTLKDYYLLQTRELEGTLSLTNYRGALIHNKKANKARVLTSPPREEQLKFNPITGRYEDIRLYQPNPAVLTNNLRLIHESKSLLPRDKEFLTGFIDGLEDSMSVNERAVVADNLRIMFTRFRDNGEPWVNFKAVAQSQIKFDIMNVSDSIETQIRRDSDVLKKLSQSNYIDSVLGPTQLQDLHDNFIANISAKNHWEDHVAPKIARELRQVFDRNIPFKLKTLPNGNPRLSEQNLHQFYLRFAHRLSMADSPDRDQLAVSLGRDLYNMANLNGDRNAWYETGMKLLDSKNVHKFFEVETFGVQKRRMKSRLSGAYFGPYYDTLAYNIRVVDPRIQEYAKLTRKVEVGLRVAVTSDKNKLIFREGYKTYFVDRGLLGLEDTRIPITSTSSFGDFPTEFVDKDMVDALNWASKTKYKIDEDYYDFIQKLLYFEDDRGMAKHYNEANEYRKFITARGDAYERFKAMEWLRGSGKAFSNNPFIDHRARIYDRGLISPQSGETFRPFLNTAEAKSFSKDEFLDFQDQIGAFVGGLSDKLEGNYNSLTITGRQKIAAHWREEMVKIGNHMLRGKPSDIRAILDSDMVAQVDGEDIGKFYRFALESAKMDNFLRDGMIGDVHSAANLERLSNYKTALALEQDASSSGAQIIAMTTKNKQLAEMSNVVPTNQKRRLYDEIAAATYNDPRFRKINEKLGLTEKDLRKAAKAQNMVESCHV